LIRSLWALGNIIVRYRKQFRVYNSIALSGLWGALSLITINSFLPKELLGTSTLIINN
jgi:hypothetical protein